MMRPSLLRHLRRLNRHCCPVGRVFQPHGSCVTPFVTPSPRLSSSSSSATTTTTSLRLHSRVANRPLSSMGSGGGGGGDRDLSRLFVPVEITQPEPDSASSVGVELAGELDKSQLSGLINKLYRVPQLRQVALDNGFDQWLFHQAFISFRRYCLESPQLPADLHIVLVDILRAAVHHDTLIPFFLRHARTVFPHIDCMDDLKKISDLREPANWYREARALNRRIVFHAGPTNSGKTHRALERFMHATSGVYCSPLKMLAVEVFERCQSAGVRCDLVTGEERRYARADGQPSPLVACTVEMTALKARYQVAVIDEIQMLRDFQRGWAWTRCLLGVAADEVHVCGEEAAIDLVEELAICCGDQVDVCRYQRLSPLRVQNSALGDLRHLEPGDCVVCFSKNDIYVVSQEVERLGRECAVIYGSLPPGTKLSQSRRFNDPNDPCKILVATDAIGMGLNLNIRRVIFYSLLKPSTNKHGEVVKDVIGCSQALQIAGRAGRHSSEWRDGLVTTLRHADLPVLQQLLQQQPPRVEAAGIYPTADQIELYGYHLPKATLSNLMDIFLSLSTIDFSLYFLCQVDNFKFLADMIEHLALPLRVRYVFCCAPIDRKSTFVCNMFLKFARQFSRGAPITVDWLSAQLGWPLRGAATITDLVWLESVFDVLDLYLWLSYRFADQLPDAEMVRRMQCQLDATIESGVVNIVRLLSNKQTGKGAAAAAAAAVNGRANSVNSIAGFKRRRSAEFAKHTGSGGGGGGDGSIGDDEDDESPTGELTKRLLSEGRITKQLIEQLRKEWSKSQSNHKVSERR